MNMIINLTRTVFDKLDAMGEQLIFYHTCFK